MDQRQMYFTPQNVQSIIRQTRHRKEIPLYVITILAGIIGVICLLSQFEAETSFLNELKNIFDEVNPSDSFGIAAILGMFIFILGIIGGIGAFVLFFVSYLASLYRLYADQMSYSIRVSEKNYPEIYAKVLEYSYLLGWRKPPEVYVQQMNGELNAFTCWVPGRVFIQLNAEMVDIAYLEHKDFDTLFFVMAHEFGHAYLHHVQIHYTIWNTFANFIPFIGSSFLLPLLSRSREYSADRVAQALTGGKNQIDCMMLLAAGRHAYKYADVYDYMAWVDKRRYNIIERFARFIVNMFADHPIMPYRTAAILDPYRRSGKLL